MLNSWQGLHKGVRQDILGRDVLELDPLLLDKIPSDWMLMCFESL